MQNRKITTLKVIFFTSILLTVIFSTGCIQEEQKPEETKETLAPEIQLDQPPILPGWNDDEYHDYHGTMQKLRDFDDKFPGLVDIFPIGKSVKGRDIWCIRITNENVSSRKFSCLIDGSIHGSEWESGEACLYFSEYILINFGKNTTITNILNTSEVYIVPLVNPDGRQKDERWNTNGIDLNRNFDVDFGRIIGGSLRIGKLFGLIKIPHIGMLTNCGRHPFSEPETQAIRNLMKKLNNYDFSFYVNCHTATHNIITPWLVFKPPFKMTNNEKDLFEFVKDWVDSNTEYKAYRGEGFYRSGEAIDWCLQEFRTPSFMFEMLSMDYDPGYSGGGKHDNLVHWMKTTLPFFMYLLVNIENLHNWETPNIQPPLPEGVPPQPLH